jgi:hypothetical protein
MPTHRGGPSVSPAQAQANPFPARYRDAVVMSDTTPEAKAIQEEALRNMTGKQRLLLAWDMSLFARELARAGIRQEHPDWTEAQVARQLLRLAFLPAPLPSGLP